MRLAILLWTMLTIAIPSVVALYPEIGLSKDQNNNENRPLLPDLEREEQKQKQRSAVRQFPTEPALAKYQIIQDSRRLQSLNTQVRESVAQKGAHNKSLIKSLDEMRKRATRLKSNLGLKSADDEKKPEGPAIESDLPALFGKLDQSVNSLVQNPLLRNTQVIDVRLSKIARADLDRIIDLSRLISTRINSGTR